MLRSIGRLKLVIGPDQEMHLSAYYRQNRRCLAAPVIVDGRAGALLLVICAANVSTCGHTRQALYDHLQTSTRSPATGFRLCRFFPNSTGTRSVSSPGWNARARSVTSAMFGWNWAEGERELLLGARVSLSALIFGQRGAASSGYYRTAPGSRLRSKTIETTAKRRKRPVSRINEPVNRW